MKEQLLARSCNGKLFHLVVPGFFSMRIHHEGAKQTKRLNNF